MGMKLTIAPVFLFLVCILGTHAQGHDWVNDSTFAAAPVSCADWLKDRRNPDPWHSETDEHWMFGFLTALVRAKGETKGGGLTGEDFPGEIDELCAAHPQSDTPAILEEFAVRHKLIAPERSKSK
jgi:hypothetical protein